MAEQDPTGGYLIEFRPAGASVQVCAIDPLTGLEVSIVGPSSAAQSDLITLAVRKLERALGYAPQDRKPATAAAPQPRGKGGIVV